MSDDEPYIDPETGKPEKRKKTITTRIPDDLYEAAKAKANREGRSLVEIIRGWLFLWVADELFSPPKLPGEGERSERSDKGKKRKPYKKADSDE